MALVECKNCGHQISDKATKCPKCGTQSDSIRTESLHSVDEIKNADSYWVYALPLLILCLVILIIAVTVNILNC